MPHTIALTGQFMNQAEDDRAEVECASVHYEPGWATPRGDWRSPVLIVGDVDIATWQRVKGGTWSHVTWDDPDRGRMSAEIRGAAESAGRGLRFTLREARPVP